MAVSQLQNRQEIRQSIGRKLADVIISEATADGDTTSLIDIYGLARGGDDEYNGRQVMIYDAAGTGGIVSGEKSFVSDFSSAGTADATCTPAFSASITDGDKYEMWRLFTVEEVNDAINDAIMYASTEGAMVDNVVDSNFTLSTEYEYDWLVPYAFGNDFKSVSKVEYVTAIRAGHDIHMCETAWDESVASGVTADVDSTYKIEGNYSLKLTIAATAATGLLASQDITSLNISDCDELEIFIRSSVALAAGDMQVLLDDTALCASAEESLDIPATLANTNTIHVIDLANPHLDTAIISVGINMVTDKTCTLYIDRIRAVKSSSKRYEILNLEHWFIVRGSSPKFGLTQAGLSLVGANTQVRLTGLSSPDIFTDDTTDSEVDPSWLISRVVGTLLVSHAKSSRLDIKDRAALSKFWLDEAERGMTNIRSNVAINTRWV